MTARRRRAAALKVDILVQSDAWRQQPGLRKWVRRALAAAASMPGRAPPVEGEVAVVLTDDDAVRILNRDWRGRDAATNVLSFPAPAAPGPGARSLGDIVIAYETVAREAEREGKPLHHHVAHLLVHGFLHLLGFDHAAEAEADAMEQRERDILAVLGVPDPYAVREHAHKIDPHA